MAIRKAKPHRKQVHVRREQDQDLAPMILDLQPVSDEEVEALHDGWRDSVVADDLFYNILRRLVHLGLTYESELYGKLRVDQMTWNRLKKDHPELPVRIDQYIADRDLILQAYKNNILFNPDHPDHVTMLRDHDKHRATRELYRLRSEERKIQRMLLEQARLNQPNVQQLIQIMPNQNTLQNIDPQQLMDSIKQLQSPLPVEVKVIKEEVNE